MTDRPCKACGYDLRGLGEAPRCPECGLVNVPEGYRRQVWALIDARRRFFSNMFSVVRKRPPGWWWSLDRPGDLRRSIRVAAENVVAAVLIVLVAGTLLDSVRVRSTFRVELTSQTDPDAERVLLRESVYAFGLGMTYEEIVPFKDRQRPEGDWYVRASDVRETEFDLQVAPPAFALFLAGLAVFTWRSPAALGLRTQLRKGLPDYARPQYTIVCAAAYESHRAVYTAVMAAVLMGLETAVRVGLQTQRAGPAAHFWVYVVVHELLFWGVLLFGGSAWIGPLRSDYTKQLIRSRRHAARIIVMYGIFFPLVLDTILEFILGPSF